MAGEMIWLRISAVFVIARLKRSLKILQRINRNICPQKICLSLPTEKIAVVLCCQISWKVLEFLWIVARPTHIAFAILVAEKSAIWALYMLR